MMHKHLELPLMGLVLIHKMLGFSHLIGPWVVAAASVFDWTLFSWLQGRDHWWGRQNQHSLQRLTSLIWMSVCCQMMNLERSVQYLPCVTWVRQVLGPVQQVMWC